MRRPSAHHCNRSTSHNTRVQDYGRLAMRVAYLGGGFAGWQRQRVDRTVQGELERALQRLFRIPITVTGAGRTDAGVHAAGQVAHFDAPLQIPLPGIRSALTHLLPPDVRVLAVWRVAREFDARRDALGKRYCYRVAWGPPLAPWLELRTWMLPHRPDLATMNAVLHRVAGCHDFAGFASTGHCGHGARGTVRTLTGTSLSVRGRRATLTFDGDGFLRGMVRRLVGATVQVGQGTRPDDWVSALLAGSLREPAAPAAPAHGLTLERVFYRSSGPPAQP